MERAVESGEFDSLSIIELRFRAVVELNWEAAERKVETWDWWSGSAMWAPRSLDRVLEWLNEERNWIYLDRAAGSQPVPKAPTADEIDERIDSLNMSPQEQQDDYDRRHGIRPSPFECEQKSRSYNHKISVTIDDKSAEAMLRCAESGDGSLAEVMGNVFTGMGDSFELPKPKGDSQLRKEAQRKSEYVKRTTPEERAADADAGRKPWEVG
jgi:hypothetical protein